jgi:putative cardiolipin synthase
MTAMRFSGTLAAVGLLVALSGCATWERSAACPAGTQDLPDCPPAGAIDDPFISELHAQRTWIPGDQLDIDPVELGKQAEIPVQHARAKFLGSTRRGALDSLAAKLWMIDNARHTVDAAYYIFKRDLIGDSILGAMCNAVRRGVDVRFMVDSIGSIHPNHEGLKALGTCAESAGFMRNAKGELTTRKARVQVVVFNAISKLFINVNRRSHDKLLIVDGNFPDRAMVMTGGRNISLSYYGINADGSPDPAAYMDAEIIVRGSRQTTAGDETVGEVSEAYFTLLFFFENNHRLRPIRSSRARKRYSVLRGMAQDQLAELKAMPEVDARIGAMSDYMENGWVDVQVLLAHEFGNLTDVDVFSDPVGNMERNPNSIQHLLATLSHQGQKHARLVSPYLFLTEFYDADGNEVLDGARSLHRWLEGDPDRGLEIITNSVLTSDNFGAQSVIDMNMAPRMLLSEDLQEAWRVGREDGETSAGPIGSAEWQKLVHHPRLAIYETGRLDDRELGGDVDYGKLHAKYIILDDGGFVGTTNFDYRSRLLNNEMGFFFESQTLADQMNADFELLKSRSYRWGSPEWLQMRQELFKTRGIKANTARSQRSIYWLLRETGLDRQF